MEDKDSSFGAKLLEYRKAHYLTQHQMAELLGVSANHIGVLERGRKNPRPSTEAAFAQLCGWREERRFHEIKPMTNEELVAYNHMWQRLNRMEPRRRKEVLGVFMKILGWM